MVHLPDLNIKSYNLESEIYCDDKGNSIIYATSSSSQAVVLKVSEENQGAELTALRQLDHPNIIKLLDQGEENKLSYLVLPYMKNGNLIDFLNKKGKGLPDDQNMERKSNFQKMFEASNAEALLCTFFLQLVNGLKACFDRGFCHRDLKPDNILVDDDFNLVLSDFGLSQKSLSFQDFVGTECYMPPEILEIKDKNKASHSHYDGAKADAFGLGVLLFCICTGKSPFYSARKRDPYYCLLEKGMTEMFWRKHGVSGLSEDLRKLIEVLLSVQPSKRFSIDEILSYPWCKQKTMDASAIKKIFE